MNVDEEFERFMEFPGETKDFVTTFSAKLFAKHCVAELEKKEAALHALIKECTSDGELDSRLFRAHIEHGEALKEERKRISEDIYEMQGTVSQFATSKECIAYNRALREAAEKITEGDT